MHGSLVAASGDAVENRLNTALGRELLPDVEKAFSRAKLSVSSSKAAGPLARGKRMIPRLHPGVDSRSGRLQGLTRPLSASSHSGRPSASGAKLAGPISRPSQASGLPLSAIPLATGKSSTTTDPAGSPRPFRVGFAVGPGPDPAASDLCALSGRGWQVGLPHAKLETRRVRNGRRHGEQQASGGVRTSFVVRPVGRVFTKGRVCQQRDGRGSGPSGIEVPTSVHRLSPTTGLPAAPKTSVLLDGDVPRRRAW